MDQLVSLCSFSGARQSCANSGRELDDIGQELRLLGNYLEKENDLNEGIIEGFISELVRRD